MALNTRPLDSAPLDASPATAEGPRRAIQTLDPGKIVTLFVIDATALGAPGIDYFHPGTDLNREPIQWQGVEYAPWPCEATGFEFNGRGQLPTPRMKVANILAQMSALAVAYDDLVGAKVTRKRVLARYLDGQPEADPNAGFPDDIYFVERKVDENRVYIEWELSSIMDLEGVKIPLRQVTNSCVWLYRGAECGYTGGPVADSADVATSDAARDSCSKTLKGCRYRFGTNPLPFGGFVSAGRY